MLPERNIYLAEKTILQLLYNSLISDVEKIWWLMYAKCIFV